jgi:hypothetical protein
MVPGLLTRSPTQFNQKLRESKDKAKYRCNYMQNEKTRVL